MRYYKRLLVARILLSGPTVTSFDKRQQEDFLVVMRGFMKMDLKDIEIESVEGQAGERISVVFIMEVRRKYINLMTERLIILIEKYGLLLAYRLREVGIGVTEIALNGPVVVGFSSSTTSALDHQGGAGLASPGSPGSLVMLTVIALWWVGVTINGLLP